MKKQKKNQAQSSPTLDKHIKSSIHDITFDEYVKLALGDISVISGKDADIEQVYLSRQLILAEFAENTGNYAYNIALTSNIQEAQLKLKLTGLILASSILRMTYDTGTFDYLKNVKIIGKNVGYPKTNSELERILHKIDVQAEFLKVDILDIEAQKSKDTDVKNTKEITRKDFVRLLASVSGYLKFNVPFDTNCAIVAEFINNMRQHSEYLESQKVKK